MKKFLYLLLSVIVLASCLSFIGCSPDGDYADFYNFTTEIHVEVYKGKLSTQVRNQIDDVLDGLEDGFSINRSNSFVSRFNSLSKGDTITLTEQEKIVLYYALEQYEFSDKKFNPAVYSLSELWGFAPTFNKNDCTIPDQEQINQLIESGVCDLENILSVDGNTLTKLLDGAKIDLGGIVKGYACDLIARLLTEKGYVGGYINVGGSSLHLLNVSSLGIAHPRKRGQLLKITTALDGVSVSTSGDYERYFEKDDQRYCHIIDGETGAPITTGVQSATVICSDGAKADALSTALMLCKYSSINDSLTPMIEKILIDEPTAMIFVAVENSDGKFIVTNQKKGVSFALLDNTYSVVEV